MLRYSHQLNGEKTPGQGSEQDSPESGYAPRLPLYKPSEYEPSNNSETSSESGTPELEKSGNESRDSEAAPKRSRKYSGSGRSNGSTKRARTLLTPEQSRVLHELLQQTCFPSTQVREAVAAKLGLSPRKVQVFFQNKRQKQRKKSNGAPMASHSLVLPVYPSTLSNEAYSEDKKYPAHPQPSSSYAPSSVHSRMEAPETNHRRSSSFASDSYRRSVSHSPEHWMNGWSHRLMDSEKHGAVLPRRPAYYDYRHHSMSGYDYTPRNESHHAPHTEAYSSRPSPPPAPVGSSSTVLPPIRAEEAPKPARLQLPSIDELISHAPRH